MNETLKPCPLCGKNVRLIVDENRFGVVCVCGVFCGYTFTKQTAIAKWNTRHYDDAPAYVRKLETLQAQLDKTTALYGCACERMEMLEKARDRWAEKYEELKDELDSLAEETKDAHEMLSENRIGKKHWALAGRIELAIKGFPVFGEENNADG